MRNTSFEDVYSISFKIIGLRQLDYAYSTSVRSTWQEIAPRAKGCEHSITEPRAVATGCEHSTVKKVRYVIIVKRWLVYHPVATALGSVLSAIVQGEGFPDQPLCGVLTRSRHTGVV